VERGDAVAEGEKGQESPLPDDHEDGREQSQYKVIGNIPALVKLQVPPVGHDGLKGDDNEKNCVCQVMMKFHAIGLILYLKLTIITWR
jgi:hypothetical protein